MAQLVGLLGTIIFWGAVVLYGLYLLRHFGPYGGPKPGGWRLGVLWLATFAGAVAIMAGTLLVAYLMGVTNCSARFSPNDAWPCSAAGRLAFGAGAIALGLPLLGFWMRFVNRTLTRATPP